MREREREREYDDEVLPAHDILGEVKDAICPVVAPNTTRRIKGKYDICHFTS